MQYIFGIEDNLKFSIDVGKVQPNNSAVPEPGSAVLILKDTLIGCLSSMSESIKE